MLKGNVIPGASVSVLVPTPIHTDVIIEDTNVVSAMEKNMKCILITTKYDKSHYRTENKATLYWMDIAEYGLLDGERFAIIDSGDGLIYSKSTYRNLSEDSTLYDVESYIKNELNQY